MRVCDTEPVPVSYESDYAKQNAGVMGSVRKLKERYDRKTIESVVGNIPTLTEIRAECYIRMIDERIDKLINGFVRL